MNSFYGVLGTSASRFYQPAIAGGITAWGRELLLWSKARIESWGFRVLYGDTDSLFILSGEEDDAKAEVRGRELVARLNQELRLHIETTWEVESKLELEYEKLYTRLLLLATRGPARRRRRAQEIRRPRRRRGQRQGRADRARSGPPRLDRPGERGAARALRPPLQRKGRAGYLRQVVKSLRQGAFDDKLVYRKALRKSLAEDTATTPPHVAAARKQSGKPGRLITYVMTTAGAEPLNERRHPLDHEHYVQKQSARSPSRCWECSASISTWWSATRSSSACSEDHPTRTASASSKISTRLRPFLFGAVEGLVGGVDQAVGVSGRFR